MDSRSARIKWSSSAPPAAIVAARVHGRSGEIGRGQNSAAPSNNPALLVRDYLIRKLGVPAAEIDDAAVIAAANACEEGAIPPDNIVRGDKVEPTK